MGKRLVEELDLASSVDTLGRWMAHYVAELIEEAEGAEDPEKRRRAQEKCCETILQVWDHRFSLPHGIQPLARLEKVLVAIEKFRGETAPWSRLGPDSAAGDDNPWLQFAHAVEGAGLRACQIAVATAIAEGAFGEEKRWVEEHGELLSEEETGIIRFLDLWLSGKQRWGSRNSQESITDLDPKERTTRVVEEIEMAVGQIAGALEALKSDLNR